MSKLDDVLAKAYSFMTEEAWTEGAKQEIKQLILEIIGEDEEPGRTMGPGIPSFQRDTLRREVRKKVKEL